MIYKFSSRATADLRMEQDVGARLLRIMGKDVTPQGILQVAAMPAALQALAAAVAADASPGAQPKVMPDAGATGNATSDDAGADVVTLRQHVWPFVEMLKQAQAAGEAVVWGV